ncbi:predicted protein, partial [Thalassiosira pseudonana CCMP1335]
DGYTVHKYLRGKLLGKGGFAKVYKVTSLDTNKEYAIKIVPKANLVKSRARQKLQTEIKIHRTLKHANICEYKHFFEDKTNCYILLELCHNQSMNEMIKRRKSLTEEEARYFMIQIIDAVSFMHEVNVIHRDLKLGNLFLNKHVNIKVGDFGLATRLESAEEKRKTICGTPNYIAPEVINGDKEKRGHSFEVDTWSMGVICYTMIVGKPPYESSDVKSTYKRILANEYSFPQGKVSNDARTLISSMLQTDPKLRPTLGELRGHPFFSQRIPSSLPSSVTISEPIWSTDEFGEIHAIKPTSALDIIVSKASSSETTTKKTVGNTLEKLDNVLPTKISTKLPTPITAGSSSTTPKFNIYDDVTTKWVTRYVDYTSKYGLGFLLNDGCSGVYFNDSTKAVISSSDDKFVYVERRKEGNTEPVANYTLTDYPESSLKKKVTLLQHFRSYLAEQQKRAEETGESEPLTGTFEERQDSSDAPMVYMKKWIRTKHAMLFRLSNGTVQVLFYDLTEVLISSEGKLITFVDKEKNRFVHSIEDIANKQQSDVSRRLKYSKEILTQLISGSKR